MTYREKELFQEYANNKIALYNSLSELVSYYRANWAYYSESTQNFVKIITERKNEIRRSIVELCKIFRIKLNPVILRSTEFKNPNGEPVRYIALNSIEII